MRQSVVRLAVAVTLGWLICEGLLRLIVAPTIFYSAWFTPGAHQLDSQFGFVFRPHYQGAMRHSDGVCYEPIQLDSHGFRKSANASETQQNAESRRAVMLGAASMAFCYGLDDHETIHHQTAASLIDPWSIDLLSWPGFTLRQDLEKLNRFSDASRYDVAIVFAYNADDYAAVDDDWIERPQDSASQTNDFVMWNSVVMPPDPASQLIPRSLYYRSYVLAGACRSAITIGSRLETVMQKMTGSRVASRVSGTAKDVIEGTARSAAVFSAARQLHQQGIPRVVVVALPRNDQVLGPEVFTEIPASSDSRAPDESIITLDLRRIFLDDASFQPDWIAGGHYGPRAAKHLARQIASELDRSVDNRSR